MTTVRYTYICDIPFDCNYYDASKAKAILLEVLFTFIVQATVITIISNDCYSFILYATGVVFTTLHFFSLPTNGSQKLVHLQAFPAYCNGPIHMLRRKLSVVNTALISWAYPFGLRTYSFHTLKILDQAGGTFQGQRV